MLSFRNEERVIPELIARLQQALRGAGIAYELVFVNDASTDRSLALLEEHHQKDPAVKVVNMSRRFGVAPCVLAGMRYAQGDAVVYMDADLQDPPELIPELVARWREGADVVYTVRTARQGEHGGKLWLTRAAYRAIANASPRSSCQRRRATSSCSRAAWWINCSRSASTTSTCAGSSPGWDFARWPYPTSASRAPAGETHFPLFGSLGPVSTFANAVTSFSHVPLVFFLLLGLAGGALSLLALLGLGAARLVGARMLAARGPGRVRRAALEHPRRRDRGDRALRGPHPPRGTRPAALRRREHGRHRSAAVSPATPEARRGRTPSRARRHGAGAATRTGRGHR